MSAHLDPAQRHDAVFYFDVTDGNPNGDPDAGNLPRVDPETMQGLVTDVSVKRKIRDYVLLSDKDEDHFDIFVKSKVALNDSIRKAYNTLGIDLTQAPEDESDGKKRNTKGEGQGQEIESARDWMCSKFYDVRTFGAVLNTGPKAGQVRGPVQLTFSRSVDPVVPQDLSITRVVQTEPSDNPGMGRKALIPYGLYRGHVFVNPMLADQTGFDADDLALFWQALQMGFDLDRSASRGLMALRGLAVFSHENKLGNAPAHTLLDRVTAARKDADKPARQFSDYDLTIHEADLPDGVKLTRVV